MPQRSATLYRYEVPMVRDEILPMHARVPSRTGLVVCLRRDEREGWGEIAPLPGFSREPLDEAQAAAFLFLGAWVKSEVARDIDAFLPPSAAFGISCALAELDGSLPETMCCRSAFLLAGNDRAQLMSRFDGIPNEAVIKIKIGRGDPQQEGIFIHDLLSRKNITLRLDANRAMTQKQAEIFAHCIAPTFYPRIAFIEEPCQTQEASRAFAHHTGIAIAWDESVREHDFIVQREESVAAIIIKPTLTGSIARCRAQCQAAHGHQLAAIISSSMESTLGLTQLARIAAWLTPDTVPGLDTADALAQQVLRPWTTTHATPMLTAHDLDEIWRI